MVSVPRNRLVYVGNVLPPLGKDTEEWLEYEENAYTRKSKILKQNGKKTVEFDLGLKAQNG